MSSIVRQYDAKTGKTYAIKSTAKWNKEKKMSVPIREVIGYFDPVTDEILPNSPRRKGVKQPKIETTISAKSVGCNLLFNVAAEKTGLKETLSGVFPETWQKLLTCAYYLLSEGRALTHCEQWSRRTVTPLNDNFPAQRMFELISALDRDIQMEFFKEWATKISENEYFALDITSISSYSKLIKNVKYGYNRDKEKLPQINMGMVVGIKTGIPICYHTYPGSVHDVSTLKSNLHYFDWLKYDNLHIVMDRGFASRTNINSMYNEGFKFLIGLPKTMSFTTDAINEVRDSICSCSNWVSMCEDKSLYVTKSVKKWEGHRCYTFVYYDEQKAVDERNEFLVKLHQRLEVLKATESPQLDDYNDRFFTIQRRQHVGKVVTIKSEEVDAFLKNYAGYTVLISNSIKDPIEALSIYRSKDRVEKSFDNIKNDLDGKRLRCHSDCAMTGRIFIQFLSLIIASYIQRIMREKKLYQNYSMQSLIEELKILMKIKIKGKRDAMFSEITASQKKILDAFGIKVE